MTSAAGFSNAGSSSLERSFAEGMLREIECGGSYRESLYRSPQTKTQSPTPKNSKGSRNPPFRTFDKKLIVPDPRPHLSGRQCSTMVPHL